MTDRPERSLMQRDIMLPAILSSLVKLDPRQVIRNPVMFVVEVGAILTTLIWLVQLFGGEIQTPPTRGGDPAWFTLTVTVSLWLTVVFGNFAEAIAEGRGKAQADALRAMRSETVATGLADDGRRLAGDRGLVNGSDALGHGAVARDHLAGLDDHDVAAGQRGGRLGRAVAQRRDRLGAHRPQRVGLRLAAALRDRLREVAERDGEPQEERDGEREPPGVLAAEDPDQGGRGGADLDHEHDRVADDLPRVELDQRREHRRQEDVALQQRALGAIRHRDVSRSRARLSSSTLTEPWPPRPNSGLLVWSSMSFRTRARERPRRSATRCDWMRALATEMSGSTPEADVVTASDGTWRGSVSRSRRM